MVHNAGLAKILIEKHHYISQHDCETAIILPRTVILIALFKMHLEYSCTNSTNQITHCEVSKSHSETSYGVSLLSP